MTLPGKVHRQYLRRGLNASQRAAAIVSHYQYIDTLPAGRLGAAMTAVQEMPLLELRGKDDARLPGKLSAGKAEREGENHALAATGTRRCWPARRLAWCATRAMCWLLSAGCRGRGATSARVIKQATRACYGLFPKRLLLGLSGRWRRKGNIRAGYGVSDNGHVFRGHCAISSKGRPTSTSYDEFWKSIEGAGTTAQWRWRLRTAPSAKSLDEIASKKRAEYRRRFQLLDDLNAGGYRPHRRLPAGAGCQ